MRPHFVSNYAIAKAKANAKAKYYGFLIVDGEREQDKKVITILTEKINSLISRPTENSSKEIAQCYYKRAQIYGKLQDTFCLACLNYLEALKYDASNDIKQELNDLLKLEKPKGILRAITLDYGGLNSDQKLSLLLEIKDKNTLLGQRFKLPHTANFFTDIEKRIAHYKMFKLIDNYIATCSTEITKRYLQTKTMLLLLAWQSPNSLIYNLPWDILKIISQQLSEEANIPYDVKEVIFNRYQHLVC